MTIYIKSLCVKNLRVCQGRNAIPQFPKVDKIPCSTCDFSMFAAQREGSGLFRQSDSYTRTHQLIEQHCICPKLFALIVQRLFTCSPPALSPIQSLPTQSSWLHFSLLIHPQPSRLSAYLASEEQLSLTNSSLNLAQPVPPTPPLLLHFQKSNSGASSLCRALATSPRSPVMKFRIIRNTCKNKARQNNLPYYEVGSYSLSTAQLHFQHICQYITVTHSQVTQENYSHLLYLECHSLSSAGSMPVI